MTITSGNINIAIVEDNGVARINLRNHLIEMGFSDIGGFSHGRELKANLRKKHYHVILMDFHLGMNKNGVEVVQELQREGLIKNTTSIVFITSDRLPMIIGQIVDVHPDALVLKPYTIRNLEKTLSATIKLNRYLRPVLKLMDEEEYQSAHDRLAEMIDLNMMPKHRSAMVKLKARLLMRLARYKEAADIYKTVLKESRNVIWAKWGLVQVTYLSGDINGAEGLLEEMLGILLTNDKACEWLARININRQQYQQAEEYIDRIKESELSLSAARLKAYLFQIQERMDDAINLIEKKRESNRNIRERFSELSFDLARLYLTLAEEKNPNERSSTLQLARYLIGSGARKSDDELVIQKRHYMNALISVLEEDFDKAKSILSMPGMDIRDDTDIPTLSDAANAWHGVGETAKASEILSIMENRIGKLPDENEKTMSELMMVKSEQRQGDKKSRALEFNKKGLEFYVRKEFKDAIDLFYQANILIPTEPAFGLNLLQSMVEANEKEHKTARVLKLYDVLKDQKLTSGNLGRLKEIGRKIKANYDHFVVADQPAPKGDLGDPNNTL